MQQLNKFKKVKSLFGKYEEFPIDWEIKTFEELFNFLRTGTNSRDDLGETGEVCYIHYGDIHAKWDHVLDCDKEKIPRIDKNKIHGLTFLKDGDLIIADASEDYEGSGASILLKNVKNRKIVSGLHTIALRNIDENIFPDFKTYINSIKFVKNQIVAYVTGISVYGLSKNNLKKIKVPLPTLKEQQKIASILSNVDSLIQKTDQIIEQTQRLKKGLMQRLLTKGIGHTKFKKTELGEIPEEWEICRIDEIKANTPNAIAMGPFGSNITANNFVTSGVPVIRGVNLTREPFHMDGFVYLTDEKANELKSANAFTGDVVFTHRGTLGQVGVIPNTSKYRRFVISQSQMKLTCDLTKVIPMFVYYFFISSRGQNALFSNVHGTGVPAIGQPTTTLKQVIIPIPQLEEQNRITNYLFSINELIEIEKKRKYVTEKLKKGLMQQLLTGKIRVKV